jgi:hypothetical protein
MKFGILGKSPPTRPGKLDLPPCETAGTGVSVFLISIPQCQQESRDRQLGSGARQQFSKNSIASPDLRPEEACVRVFGPNRVKSRLAVYSHILGKDEDLIAGTRNTYSSHLEVGEDLMTIDVGVRI